MTKNSTIIYSDPGHVKVDESLQKESKKGRSTDGTGIQKMISHILMIN